MNDYQTTVDRIQTVLNVSESSPLDDLRVLADDFADACLVANRRLSDCAKFLRVGNLPEALRLAETPPRILEICNLLEFPERADWEEVCRTYRLTLPTAPNAATLEQLNRAFEEVASIDDLLRKHRFLALSRAPLSERLDVLYSLAERDAANMIWADSIPPLERAFDVEIERDFDRLSQENGDEKGGRGGASTASVETATKFYQFLTDFRRLTTAPRDLTDRVKKFLAASARRAFVARFQTFEDAAADALAVAGTVGVDSQKRALADAQALFVAAKKAGANPPNSSIDAKNRLENAIRRSADAESARRRFLSTVDICRNKILAGETLTALNDAWAEVEAVVCGTNFPVELAADLVALRDKKEADVRAARKKKRAFVLAISIAAAVLFLLLAAGIAAFVVF